MNLKQLKGNIINEEGIHDSCSINIESRSGGSK